MCIEHCGGSHRVDMFGKGKGGKGGKSGGRKCKGKDGPPLDLDVFQERGGGRRIRLRDPGGPPPPVSFDDALHNVLTTPHPVDAAEVQAICASIASLILAAGDSAENWKLLTLALTQRRFHTRAPSEHTCALHSHNTLPVLPGLVPVCSPPAVHRRADSGLLRPLDVSPLGGSKGQ